MRLTAARMCLSLPAVSSTSHACTFAVRSIFWARVRSFACYFTGLFIFISLTFQNSLYIVYKSPLSNLRFAYLLSPSGTCLFVLRRVFFREQKRLILKSF